MSWQKFVDDNLMGKNSHIMKYAGIFGHDGNPWAISAGFNASPYEIKTLVESLRLTSEHFTDGVSLMGHKYTVIRVDSETGMVIRRKEGQNEQLPDEEKFTAIVCTTNQSVIIGVTTGSQGKANMCSTIVGALQNYLKSVGY